VLIDVKDGAVLRIALGADNLREFASNPESVSRVDKMIIEKLSFLGENFESL